MKHALNSFSPEELCVRRHYFLRKNTLLNLHGIIVTSTFIFRDYFCSVFFLFRIRYMIENRLWDVEFSSGMAMGSFI